MKFHLLMALIVLAGFLLSGASAATPDFYAGFHNLPTSVSVYHYKVPDRILLAQVVAAMKKAMQEGKAREAKAREQAAHGTASATVSVFVLPQLYLFDKNGQEIFARTAASNNLGSLLDHAFSFPVPFRNSKSLSARLGVLAPDGKSPTIGPSAAGRFTLLEYWAPWCEYCFVERDQLLAYFRKHKDLRVNWITVNADISKVTGLPSRTIPRTNGRNTAKLGYAIISISTRSGSATNGKLNYPAMEINGARSRF